MPWRSLVLRRRRMPGLQRSRVPRGRGNSPTGGPLMNATENRRNGSALSVHAEFLPVWMHDEMGAAAALIQGADDERLDPSMLVNDACRIVVEAVYAMKAEGLPTHVEGVVQWLRASGQLDNIGGPETVYAI